MRVVVPYVGAPHPDTVAALEGHIDLRDVSGSDTAYAELLCELWAAGERFAIVEHDVVPHPGALAELAACTHPYCAFPYPWTTAIGPALGCTKFSGLFVRCFPDAAEIAARIPSVYGAPGHWRQLDVWLQAAVLRDLHGCQPHCHLPPVAHRNPARAALPGAPLLTRIEGRTYLEDGLVGRIAAEVDADKRPHHPTDKEA